MEPETLTADTKSGASDFPPFVAPTGSLQTNVTGAQSGRLPGSSGSSKADDRSANTPMLRVIAGDCRKVLRELESESVQCCVTSPPYWGLRDYKVVGQIGLEKTPDEYVAEIVAAMREVWRVLKNDGTLWLNLGDSYANDTKWGGTTGGKHANGLHGDPIGRSKRTTGLKAKELVGIPWMVAFALRAEGWYLRQDIIWAKPNPMPESVRDRCTRSHEYIFLLTKEPRYFYDAKAISEPVTWKDRRLENPDYEPPRKERDQIGAPSRGGGPLNRRNGPRLPGNYKGSLPGRKDGPGQDRRSGNDRVHGNLPGRDDGGRACNDPEQDYRNKRDVWNVGAAPYPDAHFATFPAALISPCILAGSRPGDVVLDPFGGSGTTGATALTLGRKAVLIELNPDYAKLIEQRTTTTMGLAI